jgi:anti-sigma-K factor RskA
MIDERQEELAALHALDLLDGAERENFETAVAADPALAALVESLREASAMLAHTATAAEPPATLRARILASADQSRIENPRSKIISFPSLLPWAAAASFAAVAAVLGQRFFSGQSEAELLRGQVATAEIAIKSAQNEGDAAQIIARRQIDMLIQQAAGATRQFDAVQQRATDAESRLAATVLQLAAAEKKAADAAQQLAQLTSRLDAANRSAADTRAHSDELGATLASAQTRIAALQRDLQAQGDLANFKITTLASMLKNSPQAVAVAVWNPAKQEGVLKVDKLPALAADKDYQLWVVDPQYKNPVDGGVFTVDPQTGVARVKFTGKQLISAVDAFAVTLERKGGVPKAEGPFVLLGK